jgi:hypothetical protein
MSNLNDKDAALIYFEGVQYYDEADMIERTHPDYPIMIKKALEAHCFGTIDKVSYIRKEDIRSWLKSLI